MPGRLPPIFRVMTPAAAFDEKPDGAGGQLRRDEGQRAEKRGLDRKQHEVPLVELKVLRRHHVELEEQHHADVSRLHPAGDPDVSALLEGRHKVKQEIQRHSRHHGDGKHPFAQPR